MSKRKVCVVVGSRANYSSIKSVMRAVQQHSDLELQVIASASALLDRYGAVHRHIEKDGFPISARVNMLIEGETPVTMAKSTGLGLLEIPTILDQLRPDVVVTVGDRFETVSTAIAAAFMNLPLAHTMGGEISGTIDESIRHAVTKFAHLHFPASKDARDRILKLGEAEESVHLVGCPRIDLVAEILAEPVDGRLARFMRGGVGEAIDIDEPFLILSQHPVTTEYGKALDQITTTLLALREIDLPTIVLWPNADAGAEDIARGIRKWRERGLAKRMHFFKNLPIHIYVLLMARTKCLVGNSSSGIREGAFIGVPVVNIGTRQQGRERGSNVIEVPHDRNAIAEAVEKQVSNGRHRSDHIYGDGKAGNRIADILSRAELKIQKQITY